MKLIFFILCVLAVAIRAKSAHAQPPIVFYPKVTARDLVELLGEYGVVASIQNDCVAVIRDGEKSYYQFSDDNKSIQFYVGYESDISLEQIDMFNATYRYAKCFTETDSEGVRVVILTIDLVNSCGLTKEALFAFFRIVDSSLQAYHKLLTIADDSTV